MCLDWLVTSLDSSYVYLFHAKVYQTGTIACRLVGCGVGLVTGVITLHHVTPVSGQLMYLSLLATSLNLQCVYLLHAKYRYEVCPKSKCTDFPMYDLGMQHLVDVYRRVGNDLGCMYILIQTGSVESVVSYCCLCTVVLHNLCNVCDAMQLWYCSQIIFTSRIDS
jgi:hypothetical protein